MDRGRVLLGRSEEKPNFRCSSLHEEKLDTPLNIKEMQRICIEVIHKDISSSFSKKKHESRSFFHLQSAVKHM